MYISERVAELSFKAEEELAPVFRRIDNIALENTARVLEAFRQERVSAAMFAGTSGYGYDDMGRDTLEKIYARVFGTEKALVRQNFVNGTHAIACALFASLRPGDVLLAATGTPYDTLQAAIGITGSYPGSLKDYGVSYREVSLRPDGRPDIDAIRLAAADPKVRAVEIQRSRGYASRPALSVHDIRDVYDAVKSVNPGAAVILDNCYGEFTQDAEPKADLMAGSLIKNPGGGLAPTGGYVAGRADLVDAAAMRLTVPGIGGECGSFEPGYRLFFQGLLNAPHVTAQALKTAAFCARLLELLGYSSTPGAFEDRNDIIQSVELGTPEGLESFCRGIQEGSPVDSFVTPIPWDMPGYQDQVIMAAGTFVQGASIELSCDGPMREPYTAYLQGGLT
ncbi:MAG: methionine gamma-lyase family protein [Oscillospiraceae bacterium]|nr:methionine gamma-lyase family protein [Oscillospiraceae bacterium]